MKRNRALLFSFVVVLAVVLASCTDDAVRCPKCGMDVAKWPRWQAGVTLEDGAELQFCSPRCLFAWMRMEGAEGEVWLTEYYSQQRKPADSVLFVVGSDVIGRDFSCQLGKVCGAALTKRDRELILGGNAARLLRLEEMQ